MSTSFIKFLIDPFNIFWLLLIILFGVWHLKKRRLFQWVAIFTGIWFVMISTPLLPNILINSLEDQFEPLYGDEITDSQAEYHIIVLGGGHGFDDRLPPNSLLSKEALGRLNEGIRLQRQLGNSKLVLSGFSSSGGTTQAEMLEQTALLLGVNENNIILQKEPGKTYEEAKMYAEKYGGKYPVILVTSAVHMPRAMLVFEQMGLKPLASPTNYRVKGSWKRKLLGLPSLYNIENLKVGINEYVGIFWYSLQD